MDETLLTKNSQNDESHDKTFVDASTAATQMSDTMMSDSTIGSPTHNQQSTAATLNSEEDRTFKEKGMPDASMNIDVTNANFLLNGKMFDNIRCLSDSSGEAQIFLVTFEGHDYALKLYYPNYKRKKRLIRVLQNIDFEMIIRIYDSGKTYIDGCKRDYELMEYLSGGTLKEYKLNGEMKQFRRIALQGAAALAYCHKNHIIHKDVKPSNFFFRDKSFKDLVLGDFGISSLGDSEDAMASYRTTQARTPAFAAPEMYNDVIDGEVEISPAVDYYSLGITLFYLWLGRSPLSSNEREMMRQKNEGRLPHINELPERVKMIVQGLTSVNPQRRWGYEQVERWFKGENVEVDSSSPFLKYKSFVVDPDRNLIADNVHDLAPLLFQNRKLGMYYLYNKRLSAWFEECGNAKLQAEMDDIVSRRYPVNQEAGLMAAVYAMEPSFPYHDLHGNICEDLHSIALALLNFQNEYALALRNPSNQLYVYLEVRSKCNVDRIRSYFSGKDIDDRVAIFRSVYEIDNEIPFLAKFPSSTLKEISRSFGNNECSEDEWKSICDGRLLSWMYCHADMAACESVRIFTQGKPYTKSLAYKVIYNIDRESAFDLRHAETPDKIGELMNTRLQEAQQMNDADFAAYLDDYINTDGRLSFYAQLHGWYELVSNGKRCFDLKSDENRERLGAYDVKTAAYRFCKILGVIPAYQLQDGKELEDGLKIEKKDMRQIRAEIRNGNFCQWLSLFYHENPDADFTETYSYERTLEKYLLKLGDFDMVQPYYKRFIAAKEDTDKKTHETRDIWHKAHAKEKNWKLFFYVITALWLLMFVLIGISDKKFFTDHIFWTVGLPVGVASAAIVSVRTYFRGYGVMISAFFGLLGMLSACIPAYVLRTVYHSMPALLSATVVIMTLVYACICHFSEWGRHKSDMTNINEVLDDDINSTLIEPLYYTFKTKSYKYKSSKFGALEEVTNQVRSLAGETVLHYILWSVFMLILVAELTLYSPRLLNVTRPDFEQWKADYYQLVKQIKDVK